MCAHEAQLTVVDSAAGEIKQKKRKEKTTTIKRYLMYAYCVCTRAMGCVLLAQW